MYIHVYISLYIFIYNTISEGNLAVSQTRRGGSAESTFPVDTAQPQHVLG